MTFYVGTAGWALAKEHVSRFPEPGTHLERYAQRFNAVEINSAFYRDHRPQTYAKWAAIVPPNFRFAVKLLRDFTHQAKLQCDEPKLQATLRGVQELGEKLAVLLVQLPPSLGFDREVVIGFLEMLRRHYSGAVALEARHRTWTQSDAEELLNQFDLAGVVADPDRCGFGPRWAASSRALSYFRLHGTPEVYRSLYDELAMSEWTAKVKRSATLSADVWCIFDNSTFGHSIENAFQMRDALSATSSKALSAGKTTRAAENRTSKAIGAPQNRRQA